MISISFRNIRMVGERSKQLAEERAIMEKDLHWHIESERAKVKIMRDWFEER